ncbi:MAG: hypothetical protein V3U07_02455 [Nitrospirales bacterium]
MPLEPEDGAKVIQLITSRYDQREWRKKIEKTLSLPPSGIKDEEQRKIFLYFKIGLQAYKSRRADPPSWIVGGFGTKEVIERARLNPTVIDPQFTKDHVADIGKDPGSDVNENWWQEMLVKWFEEPEEEGEDDTESESDESSDSSTEGDSSSESSDTSHPQETAS